MEGREFEPTWLRQLSFFCWLFSRCGSRAERPIEILFRNQNPSNTSQSDETRDLGLAGELARDVGLIWRVSASAPARWPHDAYGQIAQDRGTGGFKLTLTVR